MTNLKPGTTTTGQETSHEASFPREHRQISLFPQGPEIVTCLHDLEVGQIIEVTVNRVEHYGAFVGIDGVNDIVALLPIVEMSWARIPDPRQFLTPGQRILVKIRGVSLNRSHVSLSMKALQPDPWLDIETKYPLQSAVAGRVASIADYGIFVELEPGIEGLIHRPEPGLIEQNAEFGKIVSLAQEVNVRILMVDPVKRRISLGVEAVHI
ncbi:S1 RNA-binding domain-containing protein [Labrys neptuniae]